MKKGLSLLLALALAVLALPALAEGTKTVNVLSWEGYVDEDTIQAFENETGIDVVWSPMDSIDDMLLKVTQSGGEGKYITKGKAIDIKWTKDSQWGTTHYYDSTSGEEIRLNPGKTWVEIVLNDSVDSVSIQ